MVLSSIPNKAHSNNPFSKSDIGAQSAWKGFSSQTLYIASRIASDANDYNFFPEDIEDLVVKKDESVIEAIQVKNISSDLTLSSLASTKSSKSGEGFFKRICSLHIDYPSFSKVRIIYFNKLGDEITGFLNGNKDCRKSILKKLTNNHDIEANCAEWLLSSLVFERVSDEQLQVTIFDQLKDCVPIMAAPDLSQSLLVQYVSDLSKIKGSTNLKQWQEQIYQIGTDIAAIDGYYKEYQKSLLRLCDLTLDKNLEQLKNEFEQGVSAHPAHIRNSLDFHRTIWLNKIAETMEKDKAVIVKGVSGQGKSALCYRYLIDHYPERLVFCVRRVESSRQAENLAIALKGIAKHTNSMIVYIDVNPGEQQWVLLIQELQARGVSVPVLVSIREEDFKMTQVDGSSVNFEVIEVNLSKQEAENIFGVFTTLSPHPQFRSFEEAWTRFGLEGPFIEFAYLLTNNQTLKQRLQAQIKNLLRESHPDSWFSLLQLVCFAGKTGCPLIFDNAKKEVSGNNTFAAIQRLSDEYLIRRSEDGVYIEALHPLRAQIICNVLMEEIGEDSSALMLSVLKCIDSNYLPLFLMEYFSNHSYSSNIIAKVAVVEQQDWIACAGLIRTMLWLDVKRYVELNHEVIDDLIIKYGAGWLSFLPLDTSGLLRSDKFIVERLASSLQNIRTEDINAEIDRIRKALTSLQIDYAATDLLIANCKPPSCIPMDDNEWSMFGYSLFWFAKRRREIVIPFTVEQLLENLLSGDIKSRADAILGIYEQSYADYYNAAIEVLSARMIEEYFIVHLSITDEEVQCYCIPPVFDNHKTTNTAKNFNHYWKMKVLHILDHMYTEKEYIEVTLIGVDLLQDLGIRALDHKARIHKSNRSNAWITEINAWKKSRIDYGYRPDSWENYLNRIDQIRRIASKLISDTIVDIEFLYKKQRHSKERWDKLSIDLSSLKQLLFQAVLLPKTVVDPYCLYREDMKDDILNSTQKEPAILGLSFNLYTNFRKSFDDTYRQLELFYDQFAEVLLARINRQNLDHINNPRLPLINLFNSAKALWAMQKEYKILFSNYRTIEHDFEKLEIEGMLTLVNIWAHVFENPMKGYAIAYDAKQLYRKSCDTIEQAFKEALILISGEAHTIDSKTYLLTGFNPLAGDMVEDKYKNVVLVLRDVYKQALSYNSVRWYLETQASELIYVPIYNEVPLGSGFQLPPYRILDVNESQLSTTLFPAELPVSLYSILGVAFEELDQWQLAAGYLGVVKMQITQYNDVISILSASTVICESGLVKYISMFSNQMSEMITKLLDSITLPLKTLELVADEDVVDAFGIIQSVFDDMQTIYEQISTLQKIGELEQKIDNAVGCMLLLKPYVLKGARIKFNNNTE